jgi:uridine kinase
MRPYLIGIAGISGSGKTTVARALAATLGGTIFSLDAYYRDHPGLTYEERCRINFDHPESLEGPLIVEHLRALAQGRPIERPVYDFTTHSRVAAVEPMQPNDYLIVEGLFTLHWQELLPLYDTRVYLDADHSVCLPRREQRDVTERGRTPESVRRQYEETVRPMADRFILPTRRHADLVLSGTRPLQTSVEEVLAHIRARLTSRA